MDKMRLPIVVCDGDDILIFRSKDEAENYLEAIDVKNDVYVAFDCEGFVIQLLVNSETEQVVLSLKMPPEQRRDALRSHLESYLQYLKVNPSWVESANLDSLVMKVAEFVN